MSTFQPPSNPPANPLFARGIRLTCTPTLRSAYFIGVSGASNPLPTPAFQPPSNGCASNPPYISPLERERGALRPAPFFTESNLPYGPLRVVKLARARDGAAKHFAWDHPGQHQTERGEPMTDETVSEAEWRRRMAAYRLRRKPWAFQMGTAARRTRLPCPAGDGRRGPGMSSAERHHNCPPNRAKGINDEQIYDCKAESRKAGCRY